MEQLVIFRDYQEQTAGDHNGLQANARQSFDHIVNDAITKSNRYAGFGVSKTAQTEVRVATGRLYDQTGAVFAKTAETTQSLTTFLAAAARRIVALSVYGQEVETDQQERDFLVNAETGETQPDAVPMARARTAVLTFTQGAEGADPQVPPIPANHAVIAYILLDTLQVVSISMIANNAVISTENLHGRANALELFRTQIEPRVSSLASDLSALAVTVEQGSTQGDLVDLFSKVADIERRLDVPALATDTFLDTFADDTASDTTNAGGLGYDAQVDTGLRFPLANSAIKAINIFSANDPNASYQNGILLPRFQSVLKLNTGEYHSDIGISQYGFQTTEIVQKTITKTRLRYGPYWAWYYPYYYGLGNFVYGLRWYYRYRYYYETYTESYSEEVTVEHNIDGALVGQSFLNSNDTWATRLGFYITSKAAAEDIWISLCEITNGQPDRSKAILVQSYPSASIVTGWNRMSIPPTFLEAGKRYAVVIVSNANHKFGMSSGQSYIDGTFFYSTDGEYFLGDLTKDLMIEVWGAKFDSAQVSIELEALNLDGGIDSIDIEAGTIAPASTNLIYEVQPNGTGAWFPLNETNVNALNGRPPLCRFRARFVGTRDMHSGIKLTGSEVVLRRPKTTMKHVSNTITLSSPSDELRVRLKVDGYDPAVHTIGCQLRVGAVNETADITEVVLRDAEKKQYEITYRFDLPSNTSSCRVVITGSAMSVGDLFHVSERQFWAQ